MLIDKFDERQANCSHLGYSDVDCSLAGYLTVGHQDETDLVFA